MKDMPSRIVVVEIDLPVALKPKDAVIHVNKALNAYKKQRVREDFPFVRIDNFKVRIRK